MEILPKITVQGRRKLVEGIIHDGIHSILADDDLIRLIRFPVIRFCANSHDELNVDFEQV